MCVDSQTSKHSIKNFASKQQNSAKESGSQGNKFGVCAREKQHRIGISAAMLKRQDLERIRLWENEHSAAVRIQAQMRKKTALNIYQLRLEDGMHVQEVAESIGNSSAQESSYEESFESDEDKGTAEDMNRIENFDNFVLTELPSSTLQDQFENFDNVEEAHKPHSCMYSIEFCEEFFDHCEFAEVPDHTSSRNEIVAAIKAGEVALKLQIMIGKIPLWSPLTNLYLRCNRLTIHWGKSRLGTIRTQNPFVTSVMTT